MTDTPTGTMRNQLVRVLATAGLILAYLFVAMSSFAAAVRQYGGETAPVLAAFVGILLFRRLTRKRSESLILDNPAVAAVPHYLRSFAAAGLRWLGLFAVIAILAAFSMEVAEEQGAAIGKVVGFMVFTMLFAWDIPYRVFQRYRRDPSAALKTGDMPWALFGGIAIPLAVVVGLVFGVPAIKSSVARAEDVKESIQSRQDDVASAHISNRKTLGDVVAYSVELPEGWKTLKQQGSVQFTLQNPPLLIRISDQPHSTGDTSQLAQYVLEELKEKVELIEELKPKPVIIDGSTWLQLLTFFEVKGEENVSIHYVYSGEEGVVIMAGITSAKPFKTTIKIMSQVMKTFRFGAGE